MIYPLMALYDTDGYSISSLGMEAARSCVMNGRPMYFFPQRMHEAHEHMDDISSEMIYPFNINQAQLNLPREGSWKSHWNFIGLV